MAETKKTATVKAKKPRGGFTQIYNAFIDNTELTTADKLVFIAIKSFADNKSKQAYPAIATISRISGVSLGQVRRSIKKLEGLGVLKVGIRTDVNHGRLSNLYTVYDAPNMWDDDFTTEEEDFKVVAREIPDDILEAEYQRRHMRIKNEPLSYTVQSYDKDPLEKQSSTKNNIIHDDERQERYTLDYLKMHFQYSIMCNDYLEDISLIDYLLQIIYDTVNSNKNTVRVAGEDKVKEVVVSVLMKLTHEEIMYVIEKYKHQANRIKYPKAYLLTQLYEAKGQMDADIINQVQNDLYGLE